MTASSPSAPTKHSDDLRLSFPLFYFRYDTFYGVLFPSLSQRSTSTRKGGTVRGSRGPIDGDHGFSGTPVHDPSRKNRPKSVSARLIRPCTGEFVHLGADYEGQSVPVIGGRRYRLVVSDVLRTRTGDRSRLTRPHVFAARLVIRSAPYSQIS